MRLLPEESPALQGFGDGYPERFAGRVPRRIRMTAFACSEPFLALANRCKIVRLQPGEEYDCWVNRYGAVVALLPQHQSLGVKPDEFEVIEWHNKPEEHLA